MIRKKHVIRKPMALLLCLLLIATFTMPVTAFGEEVDTETRDFNVNLFDYEQDEILKVLEAEHPGDKPQTVESDLQEQAGLAEPEPDYSRMFMFMNGRGAAAAPADRAWFSKWEKDHYVYQGLMKYNLNSKGRPEYTDGILGIDLFDPNESEGYDAYKDIPFEFNYDSSTGTYSYSSSKNSATFDGSGVSLGESLGGGVSVNGFRPFGSEPESVLDHFGMSMEVEFYIPKNGPAGLEFNFSGDDDVWVFVDDELVLDLGGIHGALGGIVTFEEGGAFGTIQSGAEIFLYDNGSKVDGGDGSNEISGDFSPGTTHTLKFFYLERGGNASNCSIEFNIPPTTTDFAFIKADSDTEESLPGATFRLVGQENDGATVNEDAVSDEEGIVRFVGIPAGEYTLTETEAPDGYLKSDAVYLIRVGLPELVPTLHQLQSNGLGLSVWYASEPLEGEEPEWVPLTASGDLWLWNDKKPAPEDQRLTVKKAVTGNRAPAGAEYEFMILFFTDRDGTMPCDIADDETEKGEIRNLSEIDTERQEDGEYEGYYRFLLKGGQQITFDYEDYYNIVYEYAVKASVSLPALQFHLIETDSRGAATTTIAPTGEFGTEIPAPVVDGKEVEGSLGSDSEDVVITYINAFGNKDKDKDKDRDKDDDPVIPEDPEPQLPAVEVTVSETPVPQMPKTGGLGVALFLGLGSLMAGAGLYLRRR